MIKVLEKSRGDTFWITPRLAQDQDHTVLQIRSVLIFNFKNCIQLHNETYGPCHYLTEMQFTNSLNLGKVL